MDKNSQQEKKQADDQAVEQQIEAMMGPPPNSIVPTQAKSEPIPEPAPLPPLEDTEPAADEDEPKERLLVIPSKDQSTETKTDPAPQSEPEPNAPAAGDTIVPTDLNPDMTESEDTAPTEQKTSAPKDKKPGKVSTFLKKWWHNKLARRSTIAIVLLLIAAAIAMPKSRYFILNNTGVRSSASLTVLDNSTQLPLKNVEVSLAGQAAKTDDNGNVKIEHVKLGSAQFLIQKRAFANINKTIVVGWGSNPLGSFQLVPTGSQYAIFVKDWLTDKVITDASANAGDADAKADQKGKILLTIDPALAQQDSLPVTIKSDNYRDEKINLDLSNKADRIVRMVTDRKDVYISNRSGKYDVYSIYVDGKNEKLVLAGTGLEHDDMVLVQHPTDNVAALVSTRVNARNKEGFLLSTLTLINLDDNTTQALGQSEQIQIVGWIGRRIIFVQIAAGASAADPQRFRLMSYDYKTNDKKELASANSFNDIVLEGDKIYYAPSGAYQSDPNAGLIVTDADGSHKQTLLKNEVWNIFRVSFDTMNLATQKDWYEYKIGGSNDPTMLTQSPANPKNRLYVTSQDGKHSLWVDQRDGKGLLINYDTSAKADTTLETKAGLAYPVKWLTNNILIYRIHSDQETADYVLDITGGKEHKITDLYSAAGIDRWYYY
jgi:hypothetical protein